ncbi:MAG: hypothetical protein GF350_14430 [Chitinivibrionales bacterium]|nr:hypothetical protein [Chitinivibrionales bacterium]
MTALTRTGKSNLAHKWKQIALLFVFSSCMYFPFIHQAFHIDADILLYASQQILKDPLNPPSGEYGERMLFHTTMPASSAWYRCAHPPLLPLLLAPLTRIAQNREWMFHSVLFISYILAVIGGWFFLGLFFTAREQLLGALLWAVCPAVVVNSHTVMWDITITAMILWALALFIAGVRRSSRKMIFLAGLITGIGAITKSNVFPVYLAAGTSLIIMKRWRDLMLWSLPAVFFPLLWIFHTMNLYGKIQYLSTGIMSTCLGDYRYRFERMAGYMGGAICLPVFWFWLAVRNRNTISLVVISTGCFIWSALLFLIVRHPIWIAFAYWIFSSAGCWVLFKLIQIGVPRSRCYEQTTIRIFVGSYATLLLFFPTASIRYMLPLLFTALLLFVYEVSKREYREQKVFWSAVLLFTLPLSILLSIGDYLFCEADKRLPEDLIKRGYGPSETWYYGRLSFAYYLHQAGFRFLGVDQPGPFKGDYIIHETVPGDCNFRERLPQEFKTVPVDSLEYFNYPVRTKGYFAGFYGSGRLPYTLKFNRPQRAFWIYRIEKHLPPQEAGQ